MKNVYFRNEDKYTDKDGTELENKAELVWEGQVWIMIIIIINHRPGVDNNYQL